MSVPKLGLMKLPSATGSALSGLHDRVAAGKGGVGGREGSLTERLPGKEVR